MADQNREVILSVRHLKQYFKFGKGEYKYNKAVHDVSFDVYKGEVLGLVGESGCGKTTTGRSIIKLYNITSGSVYFEGIRISAGTRWNEKEIKFKTIKAKEEIKRINANRADALLNFNPGEMDEVDKNKAIKKINEEFDQQISQVREELNEIVTRERANIRRAKYDNANYQKNFAKKHIDETKSLFLPKLKEAKKQLSFNFESIKNYVSLFLEYRGALRIAKRQTVMSKMQMIFQDPIASLDPRMTVRDIIAEGLRIRGIKNSKIIDEEVKKALNEVGLLPEHASRFPHEFSGGQRQRIGIARALVMKPDLIIADEPISALDVSIQAQVINLLNELKEKHNLTILFIAHDLSVVKYFCDRIAVMYFGNLVELASSDELFKHPIHPYTKSLLSAIPLPDPHYEKNRKRIEYNPKLFHEYDGDKPSLREVSPNHFVRCNQKEYDRIIEELK